MVSFVRTVLKGKGKISHLMCTGRKQGNPRFEAWDEDDSIIMAWLWNSMTPEISDTCEDDCCKIGRKTVTEYVNQLKALWQELDHYRVIKTKCPKDAAVLKDFIEQDRSMIFLLGLTQNLIK
ncbi:hypothetical protein CK203_085314 [Vitis vinifera]|uniref:Retrotransposon gag domain-containing protein n=1 Tax=Vitis vinifera TaxID=29760 RepID=A0A438DD20_VITVI|nr:hypothetical protein CK203_085314 [Vitis vinifera]